MIRRTFVFLMVTALVQACALVPASGSVPTFDPNSVSTSIVQTANAAATQTALVVSSTPLSTNTPTPTLTSLAMPSPTATFIFILATPTVPSNTPAPGSSGLKFDCQVVSKNPPDDSHLASNSNFTMVWTVMNMGTEVWDSNDADYRFRSGDKLHKVAAYDLESSVPTGGQTEIKVAMKSPQAAGTYSTTWVIRTGQTEFCRMGITIKVP